MNPDLPKQRFVCISPNSTFPKRNDPNP